MNFIKHIIEPKKLIMTWRPPYEEETERYPIAEILKQNDKTIAFNYLVNSPDFIKAKTFGFENYPAFPDVFTTYTTSVLSALTRRIPPRSRGDFSKYLESFCLSPKSEISDFALLGYTGAKLPSDRFAIVHPFENTKTPCEFLLEHIINNNFLVEPFRSNIEGQRITFLANDTIDNPYATKILVNGKSIGHVTKALSNSFHYWLKHKYTIYANIEKINGSPSRPIIYLYVRVLP